MQRKKIRELKLTKLALLALVGALRQLAFMERSQWEERIECNSRRLGGQEDSLLPGDEG